MRTNIAPARDGCFIDVLEARQLLSASPLLPNIKLTPVMSAPIIVSPTPGVVLHEQAGTAFTADLGTFATQAPTTNLQASIQWGDGTTSAGTLVPVATAAATQLEFAVDGSHTYRTAGQFPITVVVTQPGPTPTTLIRLVATLHDTAIVTAKTTVLDGTITGKYSLAPTAAALGGGYVFNGTGTAGALGSVSAHGLVTLPGLSATTGQATGTLTLTETGSSASAVNNSVTLSLIGPIQASPGTFPTSFAFTITGGTGAFAGASGSGTIAVTLGSDMSFTFTITSTVLPTPVLLAL